MLYPKCRPLLLLAVAGHALLASVQEQRAAAQLTIFREPVTPPLPYPGDPYPNMIPRTCVECTSRALFFVSFA